MFVQPFLSVSLICSNDSLPASGWVFSHSCQWIWSAHTLEGNLLPGWVFSHSSQWFWSAQTHKSNSLAKWVFSHSCQWFWSAGEQLTPCSALLISDSDLLNTEEWLTSWMVSMHTCQWFWTAQTLKSNSLPACSAIFISGSNFLKDWKGTHSLDVFSAILINGTDLLKNLTATHKLDTCSAILFSGSNLLEHRRVTHNLNACSAILISGFDLLNAGNSLSGCVFSHSHLWLILFWSNTREGLTFWMHVQPF